MTGFISMISSTNTDIELTLNNLIQNNKTMMNISFDNECFKLIINIYNFWITDSKDRKCHYDFRGRYQFPIIIEMKNGNVEYLRDATITGSYKEKDGDFTIYNMKLHKNKEIITSKDERLICVLNEYLCGKKLDLENILQD